MAQLPRLHVDKVGVIKAIKDGPGNYLGTDKRGRAHWRKNAQAGGGKSGGGKALVGHEAIEHAEKHGLKLSKYADPTEGARHGLSPDEAREVAAEDPSLIYLKQGAGGGNSGGDQSGGNVPKTRDEAIRALVELDVAKWGEGEREAAERLHRANYRTYGLALNALAHRPEHDFGDRAPHLVAAAKAALTDDDRRALRQGG